MAGYDPPPFFKQGPAPLALLTFYVALGIALLVLDARFRMLEIVRQAVSVATHPVQVVAHLPARGLDGVADYFADVDRLQKENDALRAAQLSTGKTALRMQELESENAQLRRLLGVRERSPIQTMSAQVLYTARDPYTRRIVIDQGMQANVQAGQPVVDEKGILGQVTRVFPLVSEVTLTTDKDHSIPVKIVRNGLRSVSFGLGQGQMELRYMPANADVQVGDIIVTSGLDGIYHAGYPVGRVDKIERDTTYSFARILCSPLSGVENFSTVLLLKPKDTVATLPTEAEKQFRGQNTEQGAPTGARRKVKAGAKR